MSGSRRRDEVQADYFGAERKQGNMLLWMKRVWRKFRFGGIDYLMTATASYLPDWFFDYHHLLLLTRQVYSSGQREQTRDKVSIFDKQDHERLSALLGWSDEKLRRRFAADELCFGVVEQGKLVSYKWVRCVPTMLREEKMHSPLDPADTAFYLHTGYTIPAARRRGLSLLCSQVLFDYFAAHGRSRMYTAVEYSNEASRTMHGKLGSEVVGETFFLCLLGLRLVYRRRWPTQVKRLEWIRRRPSGPQIHVETKHTVNG